jgi:hypothetical protein
MRVTVGVSGGIAAYKAAELVRALQRQAVEVHVVMTAAAAKFVQPLTFAALTGHKVITSLWDESGTGDASVEQNGIDHIAEAQWTDALVVAPATAEYSGQVCAWHRRRFSDHDVPGDHCAGAGCAGHEREHVEPSRPRRRILRFCASAGCGLSSRARAIWPAAWWEPGAWRSRRRLPTPCCPRAGPAARSGRRSRAGDRGGTREALDPVRFSATVPAARWATRWLKPRRAAGRR